MKRHHCLKDIHNEALRWTNQLLAERNLSPVSSLTLVREMAWSVVAKVQHDAGDWYFKCLPESFAHELPLSDFLSSVEPRHVGQFIGMDAHQGFLMIADAGPMLRECYEEKLDAALWFEALEHYARLQISLMNDSQFQNIHLPNRSLSKLPQLIGPHVKDVQKFNGSDATEHLLDEHIAAIDDAFDHWNDWVQPLYQYGITDTLNHGDLHDGNIAFKDNAVIFDWGDASVTHPFMSLRNVFSSIERRFGFKEGSPELEPFLKAYLTPWTQFASYEELKAMLSSAQKVWALVTFLSWQMALANQTDERATQYNYAIPALLREFVEAQP